MKPRLSFLIATAAILCIAWVSTRGLDNASPLAELAIYGYNIFAAILIYAVVETLPASWPDTDEVGELPGAAE